MQGLIKEYTGELTGWQLAGQQERQPVLFARANNSSAFGRQVLSSPRKGIRKLGLYKDDHLSGEFIHDSSNFLILFPARDRSES